MSEDNPYQSTDIASDGFGPSTGAKPTSIKVFGILNLVFGALSILGLIMSSAMFFVKLPRNPNVPNPALDLMETSGPYRAFMMISLVLGLIFTIVQIMGGVGLLQYRRSGRRYSITYALYAILAGIIGGIVNYILILAPMMEKIAEQQQGGAGNAIAMGGAVGGMAGMCFGLIYPILLLVFMSKPYIINALD